MHNTFGIISSAQWIAYSDGNFGGDQIVMPVSTFNSFGRTSLDATLYGISASIVISNSHYAVWD